MENGHEPKSYLSQWGDEFTAKGLKYSYGPLIPSASEIKEQSKIIFKVACMGPYYIGKFCFNNNK